MSIKIDYGHGVTELVENNGEWRIKRNNAKVPEEKLKELMKVFSAE